MAKSHIVVGLSYGDEGKGVFTDYLANNHPNPLVIRYNGGHQAGHTVTMEDGRRHVFSSFGSGSFRGAPTFISKYCTINPPAMINEYNALINLGVEPVLYVDPLAMVTTPYDIAVNEWANKSTQHGSVGVGFGATIERNKTPYKLHAMDLFFPEVLMHKMKAIKQYHSFLPFDKIPGDKKIGDFVESCFEAYQNCFEICSESEILKFDKYQTHIYEGAQGTILDMDYGFFPHVTHSNTTCKNAVEMIKGSSPLQWEFDAFDVYYLTRAYATRHGNGPFQQEHFPIKLVNTEKETNVHSEHQGNFRTGMLDWDMLAYAMQCNWNYSRKAAGHIVISCLDQLAEYAFTSEGEINRYESEEKFVDALVSELGFSYSAFLNHSPTSDTIVEIKTW